MHRCVTLYCCASSFRGGSCDADQAVENRQEVLSAGSPLLVVAVLGFLRRSMIAALYLVVPIWAWEDNGFERGDLARNSPATNHPIVLNSGYPPLPDGLRSVPSAVTADVSIPQGSNRAAVFPALEFPDSSQNQIME